MRFSLRTLILVAALLPAVPTLIVTGYWLWIDIQFKSTLRYEPSGFSQHQRLQGEGNYVMHVSEVALERRLRVDQDLIISLVQDWRLSERRDGSSTVPMYRIDIQWLDHAGGMVIHHEEWTVLDNGEIEAPEGRYRIDSVAFEEFRQTMSKAFHPEP